MRNRALRVPKKAKKHPILKKKKEIRKWKKLTGLN
jgi:hypothetical protein